MTDSSGQVLPDRQHSAYDVNEEPSRLLHDPASHSQDGRLKTSKIPAGSESSLKLSAKHRGEVDGQQRQQEDDLILAKIGRGKPWGHRL